MIVTVTVIAANAHQEQRNVNQTRCVNAIQVENGKTYRLVQTAVMPINVQTAQQEALNAQATNNMFVQTMHGRFHNPVLMVAMVRNARIVAMGLSNAQIIHNTFALTTHGKSRNLVLLDVTALHANNINM